MMAIYGPLQLILSVVYFVMIVHIIMSWLINFLVLNLRQPLVYQIWSGLNQLLELVLQTAIAQHIEYIDQKRPDNERGHGRKYA